MKIVFGVFHTIGLFARDFLKKRNSTLENPIINQNVPISTPSPVQQKPTPNRETRVEKEGHMIKRHFAYAVKCKCCGAVYDDRLTECPKCGENIE